MARILIVEDNEMNRDMLARRLKRRGHVVETAEDGVRGVAFAPMFKPDLILMDMTMPLMDGWTATRQLKADPDTAEIVVIALTAHALPGDRERALEAGCDAYLSKPVRFAELEATIDALLGPEVPTTPAD